MWCSEAVWATGHHATTIINRPRLAVHQTSKVAIANIRNRPSYPWRTHELPCVRGSCKDCAGGDEAAY